MTDVRNDAQRTVIVDPAGTSTPYGSTLFPNDADLAAQSQGAVDQQTGFTNTTVAQYFSSVPTIRAASQFGGESIFVNTTSFATTQSAFNLFTIFHEVLHHFSLGDDAIRQAFDIDAGTFATSGSESITVKLLAECGVH